MFKFTIGCLEVVMYLVAQITKDEKSFYVKCTKGEWEPRPEVPYKLFRVIEITRDTKSDLRFKFEVRDAQGVIDPLDWEAGTWWKYSHLKGMTLRVALDEKTDEVFKVCVWEQNNGKFTLNVEHHDEPVEEKLSPKPAKPAPVEVVYQHVEVIKPRHNNGNGHHGNSDGKDETSRDFYRAKAELAQKRDDDRSTGDHKASRENTGDSASPEEVAEVVSASHELVQRIDLNGISPIN